ncbi:MAG TPA: hypothetical protein VK599_15755 [Streptosporangiaceae bacterium]|nr:hypothetical protein [Streptosporangiaceae bacterium]
MTSKSKLSQKSRHVVDMSLPAEQRRRKRKAKRPKGKGRIAQMDHANHPEHDKRRREFWKKEGRE